VGHEQIVRFAGETTEPTERSFASTARAPSARDHRLIHEVAGGFSIPAINASVALELEHPRRRLLLDRGNVRRVSMRGWRVREPSAEPRG
jgi:hypothetical protein